jgi:hypothetical protein
MGFTLHAKEEKLVLNLLILFIEHHVCLFGELDQGIDEHMIRKPHNMTCL